MAWLTAGAGLALGLWPLVAAGELTTLGGAIDAIHYLTGAERLQLTGLASLPAATAEDPISQIRAGIVTSSLRQGDQYFLATFASLTDLRPHRLFSVAMALWGTLLPLGIYAFARRALGARRPGGRAGRVARRPAPPRTLRSAERLIPGPRPATKP